MDAYVWFTLVTSAAQFALFVLAVTRGSKSPMGLPLGFLSLAIFTSNLGEAAHDVTKLPVWEVIDNTASPFAAALAFHVTAAFVGKRRQLNVLLFILYAVFGSLALSSLLGLWVPAFKQFAASPEWSWTFLAAIPLPAGYGVWLLTDHLVHATGEDEKQRTRLIFLALFILVVLGPTGLVHNTGLPIPRLSNLGFLVFTALTAVVALRLRLFERDLSTSLGAFSLALGAFGILVYVSAFRWLAPNGALLVLATLTLSLILTAAAVPYLLRRRERSNRMSQLALTGRFAAQMAHDLKNPLAAAKGAVQFLAEEVAQGRPLADSKKFLGLIEEQLGRLESVVNRYHRLSHVEPVFASTDINDVVRRVLALQGFAAGQGTTLSSELAADLPKCSADPDLVATAIENLVRNAFEAMPNGGTVTVRTEHVAPSAIAIAVQDTGQGMDARTKERIFDDFYTTKATGTGLGLAFVRRVAKAHHGDVEVHSTQGQGTTLRVILPAAS